ncbi:DUF2971 domain-containing protein [Actibacterium sp. XHP0104]|uniref:DUF2971 domain-containing protein n=1 Tax=Actibacterium sp. XHP0104 TaxID=2984335 RepID=UPI0021E73064|nr:DUF2971 domain-containing protein [Actibacterium sp. XHP0104]MCV2880730.1 DUF2971 domain-containing protein [Actibacterium sp. XHP0104]
MTPETHRKISELLFPYALRRAQDVKDKHTRFVHYTSAEAAMNIIASNSVWLRSASVMNDLSEVRYGHQCLLHAWNNSNAGERLKVVLDQVQKGKSQEFVEHFNTRLSEQFTQTFLLSLSEHGDVENHEDKFGRLSMWRAYGGTTNVALVLNNRPFMSDTNTLNAFTSPVSYGTPAEFSVLFDEVVTGLETNIGLVQSINPQFFSNMLFAACHFAVLSAKHPGFKEEREWRVCYSPSIWPSDKLIPKIEIINGVPQKVFVLPLKDYPEEGFTGATIPDLIEEILIGPTDNPQPMREALIISLGNAGVTDPHLKVRVSDIPLRR